MHSSRTVKILGLLAASYGLALAPAWFWPSYLDSPVGVLAMAPLLLVYLLHSLGIPGLLQHGGLCGAGWCSPTWFGWVFAAAALVLIGWGIAWCVASLTRGK